VKIVVKDRYEALRPRILKGIIRGRRKTQTIKGEKGKINISNGFEE